ncbi:MAG: metal ABC transporter permease [bacterium]|nr:metal ABC transporter permease [bacterium]
MDYLQLIAAIFVGATAGYLGSFMVLRRMALVGDALSHVALPGIALALMFNFSPPIGAFAALFGGIIVVWLLENKTKIATEALIGLIFTVSLSIGLLITPDEELLEALFGDISTISLFEGLVTIFLSILVLLVMKKISKSFMLSTISNDLAKSVKIRTSLVNFGYLMLVAVIVALGIKTVGTLLMGALVVIPAIASKNVSGGLSSYVKASTFFGALSGAIGVLLAFKYGFAPGPMVVLASAGIFLITLVFKKN